MSVPLFFLVTCARSPSLSFEQRQTVFPLSPALVDTLGYSETAYLDLVNNSAGYTHIALFSPSDSSEAVFVTDGEWEVVDGVLGVDAQGVV